MQLEDSTDVWLRECASILKDSHGISQRLAEGIMTVLTHSVDTSLRIFRGEWPVTQSYCAKNCGGKAAWQQRWVFDNITVLWSGTQGLISVLCDNRSRPTIHHCKETLWLDLTLMLLFFNSDNIFAQASSCSNEQQPSTHCYQPQCCHSAHSAKVTSLHIQHRRTSVYYIS